MPNFCLPEDVHIFAEIVMLEFVVPTSLSACVGSLELTRVS